MYSDIALGLPTKSVSASSSALRHASAAVITGAAHNFDALLAAVNEEVKLEAEAEATVDGMLMREDSGKKKGQTYRSWRMVTDAAVVLLGGRAEDGGGVEDKDFTLDRRKLIALCEQYGNQQITRHATPNLHTIFRRKARKEGRL